MEKDMKQYIPAEQLVWPPWEGEGGNVCPTWSQKDFHPAARTPDNYVLCLWRTGTSEWCCSGSEISLSTGNLSGETSLPRHHPTAVVSFFKTFQVKSFFSYLCSCLQDQGDLILYHCDGHRLHVFHPPAFGYSATAAVSQERLDQVAGGSRR